MKRRALLAIALSLPCARLMGQLPPSIQELGGLTTFNTAGIVTGPDGALWFTERSVNKIGRMSAGGVVTEYPGLTPGEPTSITVGPDRALWFADRSEERRVGKECRSWWAPEE